MNRKIFILLNLVPLIMVIISVLMPYFIQWNVYYFFGTIIYLWTLQVLRLNYLGFSHKQSFAIFLFGPFNNSWWKMWKKDSECCSTKS